MNDPYETNNAPRQTPAPPRWIVSAPGSLVLDGFQVSFKTSFFWFWFEKKTSTDEGPFHPQTWVCPDSETTRLLRRFKQTSDICLRKRSFDAIQTNEILRMEEKHTYNYHFAGIKAQINSKLLKNIVCVNYTNIIHELTNVAPPGAAETDSHFLVASSWPARSRAPGCVAVIIIIIIIIQHHHHHNHHHLYHRPHNRKIKIPP